MAVKLSSKTLNKPFIAAVESLSGECLSMCMQCGACSGGCPMTHQMDVLPRKLMHMMQLGMENRLMGLNTYWVCSACHMCNVLCPRGIDLPRVMEAMRLMTLRKNINYVEPSKLPAETLRRCPQIALVAAFRKATS